MYGILVLSTAAEHDGRAEWKALMQEMRTALLTVELEWHAAMLLVCACMCACRKEQIWISVELRGVGREAKWCVFLKVDFENWTKIKCQLKSIAGTLALALIYFDNSNKVERIYKSAAALLVAIKVAITGQSAAKPCQSCQSNK